MSWLTGSVKKTLTAIGVVAVFVTTGSTGLGMIGRYLQITDLTWSFEMTGLAFVWVITIGTVLAEVAGENVALDLIDNSIGKRGGRILTIVRALILLAIAGFLLWSGLAMLERTASIPTPVMRLPMGVVHSSIAVCATGLGIVAIFRLVRSSR
ncbi:MAG: TRAP transporter small permease [Dehalococcoidia bacterium]